MSIRIRIVATYPAEDGDPEETFDLTYLLRPEFAATPGEAHARIVRKLQTAEVVSFPVVDQDWPVRYDSHAVEQVWVW